MPAAAVLAVSRNELRRRWRGLLAIGAVAAVTGVAVVGGLAVARRTATAAPRLVAATHLDDARAMVFGPPALAPAVAALPQVERSWIAQYGVGRLEGHGVVYLGLLTGPPKPGGLFTPVIVDGRDARPTADDEVVVEERAARSLGLRRGSTVRLAMLTPEEVAQFDTGFGEPDGPRVELRVVGIARIPGGDARMPLITSAAFSARYGEAIQAGPVVFARLRGGRSAAAAFAAGADRLARAAAPGADPAAAEFSPVQVSFPHDAQRSVAAAGRVVLGGLSVCVLVAALAGVVAVGQAFARQHAAGSADQRVEAALGMTGAERVAARVLPALVAVVLAAVGTLAGGLAAGVLEPLGASRRIEPHPGFAPNVVAAVTGALVVGLVVLAVAAWTARRAGRPRRALRPASVVSRRLVLAARRPAAAIGLRFALDRGRERLPVRSSLVAVVAGVTGVVAALSFAGSLSRLDATPARWGWSASFAVEDVNDQVVGELLADARVGGLSVVRSSMARVAGGDVALYAFEPRRRSPGWSALSGRAPRATGEVMLGSHLAARLDARTGDRLRVEGAAGQPVDLQVVGVGVGPGLNTERLGDDLLVAPGSFGALARTSPFVEALVEAAPGVDGRRLAADVGARHEVTPPRQPSDVANVTQLVGLPDLLAGFLAFVAVGALAHALVVTVRRRRTDLGVLRAIGCTPRQAGSAILAMALVAASAGLLVGVPLGYGVGRLVWWEVARTVGVATDVVFPAVTIAMAAAALLLLAVVVALLPARRAVTVRPAAVLRVE